jgi:two-component system OmpR family response regulator
MSIAWIRFAERVRCDVTAKILVVDDESDVLMIIRTALEHEGFQVSVASNGPDGIEAAKEVKPDLIVLDVMMPGMDGFEVLRRLKSDDDACLIPVLMLTGVSDRARIQEALASGIDYYIVKPFDIEDLIQKIRTVLKQS